MADEKDKKPSNLEGFVEFALSQVSADAKNNFDKFGDWLKETNSDERQANLATTSIDKGYAAAVSKIDDIAAEAGGDGNTQLDKDKVIAVATEYMQSIVGDEFKASLGALKDIKDPKNRYKVLSSVFDDMVLAGQRVQIPGGRGEVPVPGLSEAFIDGLLKQEGKDGKITANKLKIALRSMRAQHEIGAKAKLEDKAESLMVGTMSPVVFASMLVDRLAAEGYKPKSESELAEFLTRQMQVLVNTYGTLINKGAELYDGFVPVKPAK